MDVDDVVSEVVHELLLPLSETNASCEENATSPEQLSTSDDSAAAAGGESHDILRLLLTAVQELTGKLDDLEVLVNDVYSENRRHEDDIQQLKARLQETDSQTGLDRVPNLITGQDDSIPLAQFNSLTEKIDLCSYEIVQLQTSMDENMKLLRVDLDKLKKSEITMRRTVNNLEDRSFMKKNTVKECSCGSAVEGCGSQDCTFMKAKLASLEKSVASCKKVLLSKIQEYAYSHKCQNLLLDMIQTLYNAFSNLGRAIAQQEIANLYIPKLSLEHRKLIRDGFQYKFNEANFDQEVITTEKELPGMQLQRSDDSGPTRSVSPALVKKLLKVPKSRSASLAEKGIPVKFKAAKRPNQNDGHDHTYSSTPPLEEPLVAKSSGTKRPPTPADKTGTTAGQTASSSLEPCIKKSKLSSFDRILFAPNRITSSRRTVNLPARFKEMTCDGPSNSASIVAPIPAVCGPVTQSTVASDPDEVNNCTDPASHKAPIVNSNSAIPSPLASGSVFGSVSQSLVCSEPESGDPCRPLNAADTASHKAPFINSNSAIPSPLASGSVSGSVSQSTVTSEPESGPPDAAPASSPLRVNPESAPSRQQLALAPLTSPARTNELSSPRMAKLHESITNVVPVKTEGDASPPTLSEVSAAKALLKHLKWRCKSQPAYVYALYESFDQAPDLQLLKEAAPCSVSPEMSPANSAVDNMDVLPEIKSTRRQLRSAASKAKRTTVPTKL